MSKQEAYEDSKSANEEISAGQSQIDAKMVELASTKEKNARCKDDFNTCNNLSVDEEFSRITEANPVKGKLIMHIHGIKLKS